MTAKMLKILLIILLHGLTRHLATSATSKGPDITNIPQAQPHVKTKKHLEDVEEGNEAVDLTLSRKSPLMMKISETLSSCGKDICHDTNEILPPFLHILNKTSYYVDKTLLVETFLLSKDDALAVTAPSRFGKTFNLRMLQAFFQVPIAKNGSRIPNEKSRTYKVFKLLKIGESPYFKYFGSRPVIYMDFMKLHAFTDAKDVTKQLYRIFEDSLETYHPYLCDSTDTSIVKFREECLLSNVDASTLYSCLRKFGTILKGFENIVPLVLIDEFTCPFQYVLSNRGRYLTEKGLSQATDIIATFYATMAKEFLDMCFWRVYSTGIVRYGETYSFYANNLIYKSIFQDEGLADQYGFTDLDVDELATFHGLDSTQRLQIREYFDGYGVYDSTKTERRLYCSAAVINYINSGSRRLSKTKLSGFFYGSPLEGFQNLLSLHRMGNRVLESLKPDTIVTVPETDKLTLGQLLLLRDAEISGETGKKKEQVESDFFYYMMENGLYSGKKVGDRFSLTIPNKAARATIENAILKRNYFDSVIKCTDSEIQNFRDNIKKIKGTSENLASLTDSIARLFTHPNSKIPDTEFELGAPLYTYMVLRPDNYIDAQLYLKPTVKYKKRFIDIFYLRNDGMCILIETRHYTAKSKKGKQWHSSVVALSDIIERNYTEKLEHPDIKEFLLAGVFMNETICQCSTLYNTYDVTQIKTHTVYLDQLTNLDKRTYAVKTKGAQKKRKKRKNKKRE